LSFGIGIGLTAGGGTGEHRQGGGGTVKGGLQEKGGEGVRRVIGWYLMLVYVSLVNKD